MSETKPTPTPHRSRRETEESSAPTWILPAVIIATLVVGGWFIIQNLSDTSRMEDCQMAGRHNCVPPIDTSNMK
jgi:hypothetical protein